MGHALIPSARDRPWTGTTALQRSHVAGMDDQICHVVNLRRRGCRHDHDVSRPFLTLNNNPKAAIVITVVLPP